MTDTIGPAEAEAGGILTIDLGAIAANWRALRARAAPAQCAAVVKADGYGCGIEQVVRVLAKAGCETFFVANLAEARRARTAASGAAIYVLNGLLPGTAPAYAGTNIRPVLGSVAELEEWTAFRASCGWTGEAALHFDTGMNRLGFAHEEAAQIAGRLGRDHGIALVMSHFVISETPGHTLNGRQLGAFREVTSSVNG